MKRLLLLLAACGDNASPPPLFYTDPAPGGKLRLVRDDASTGTHLVLDFVVGNGTLRGYSTGFDLAVDSRQIVVASFTPGTALDPGTAPIAANAVIATAGPLANQLVAAQSQKATTSPADATLPPGTLLFQLALEPAQPYIGGRVFDGADDVTSAGLRDRLGNTIVDTADVAIGKLVVLPPP